MRTTEAVAWVKSVCGGLWLPFDELITTLPILTYKIAINFYLLPSFHFCQTHYNSKRLKLLIYLAIVTDAVYGFTNHLWLRWFKLFSDPFLSTARCDPKAIRITTHGSVDGDWAKQMKRTGVCSSPCKLCTHTNFQWLIFFSWAATALQYFKLSFPSFYWWKPRATPSLLTLKVNAITRRKRSGYLLKHDNYSTACMCITMDFLYAESAETNSSHEFALCLGHFGQPLNLFELYSFNVISFHLYNF